MVSNKHKEVRFGWPLGQRNEIMVALWEKKKNFLENKEMKKLQAQVKLQHETFKLNKLVNYSIF